MKMNIENTIKSDHIKKSIIKFKKMLSEDFENDKISCDEYTYFMYELASANEDYLYGLYMAYLILRK